MNEVMLRILITKHTLDWGYAHDLTLVAEHRNDSESSVAIRYFTVMNAIETSEFE